MTAGFSNERIRRTRRERRRRLFDAARDSLSLTAPSDGFGSACHRRLQKQGEPGRILSVDELACSSMKRDMLEAGKPINLYPNRYSFVKRALFNHRLTSLQGATSTQKDR